MWPAAARFVLHGANVSHVQTSSSVWRNLTTTASRNTVVVERCWNVPLSKEGRPPRLYPRRHRVYRLIEDSKRLPREKMELILTQTVAKLGGRGDTVLVKKSVGRNTLLREGLAVYPSPENRETFAEERRMLREGRPEDRVQTRTGQLTVAFLKKAELEVFLHTSLSYSLTKEIISRQFLRRLGVVVPLHALTLPEEPITAPGRYWCDVTVNGVEAVRVPLCVVPYVEPSERRKLPPQSDDPCVSE